MDKVCRWPRKDVRSKDRPPRLQHLPFHAHYFSVAAAACDFAARISNLSLHATYFAAFSDFACFISSLPGLRILKCLYVHWDCKMEDRFPGYGATSSASDGSKRSIASERFLGKLEELDYHQPWGVDTSVRDTKEHLVAVAQILARSGSHTLRRLDLECHGLLFEEQETKWMREIKEGTGELIAEPCVYAKLTDSG